MDVSPIRESRDFRLLLGSSMITMFGSFVTLVAVPYQAKELTGSYLVVGLLSAAELIPMVVCGLWGGAIADALDRRKIIVYSEIGLCLSALALLVNALLPEPQIWVLYVAGAASAGLFSIRGPSEQAVINRVLKLDQMGAAFAIQGLVRSIGSIAGPALGGVMVVALGPAISYSADIVSFLVSLLLLVRVRTMAPPEGAAPASLDSLLAGVRYAVARPDLMGTYLVDIAAMAFAFSTSLFPFMAEQYGGSHESLALGLLAASPGIGAVLASLTSGWTAHVHRHGLGVIISALFWGAWVAVAAVMPSIWLIIACLVAAGAADMYSGIFRGMVWNQTIPDEYRGRLAGIELLSYSTGPMLGNTRASLMANLGGLRFSLGIGGLLCMLGVLTLGALLPKFRAYDVRTSDHAQAERTRRSEPTAAGELSI